MVAAPVAPSREGHRPRGLRRLLVAEVVSTTGSQLTTVSLSWFVLTTTRSPARSGLVMAAEVVPVVLFGFVSGGWAQRTGPKRWMVGADLARAPLVAAVPLLARLGLLPFPLLLAVVFAAGIFTTPYTASQQMLIAEVVGDDETALTRATSTLQSATRLTLLLGPPAAGALIAALGAPAVLYLDAASYLLVVPLVASTPTMTGRSTHHRSTEQAPTPQDLPAPRTRVFDGITTVYRDRLLGAWTTASFFSEITYQGLFVAIPVLTLFRYHAAATLAGVLLAGFGVGALVGSLTARRLADTVPARRIATTGKIASAVIFPALLPAWPAAGLLIVIAALGVSNGLTNGPVAAVRLARLPPSDRAGGLTAISTVPWLGGFLGLATAGPALQATSPPILFTVLTGLQLLSATVFTHGSRHAHRAEVPGVDPTERNRDFPAGSDGN